MLTQITYDAHPTTVGAAARWVNIILGVWLFVSAFLWPHTAESQANTWILGAFIAYVAALGIWRPGARWINSALAVWLFVSTFTFIHLTAATIVNNLIVAMLVFFFSALSDAPTRARPFAI